MADTNNSWYSTGYGQLNVEKQRVASMNVPDRMWMKEGTVRDLVFVDDEPTIIYEHNPKLNGEWKNWITCLRGVHDDVACCQVLGPQGYTPYLVGYYTVIDCTPYTDSQGNVHQFEMKFFPAKKTTLELLDAKRKNLGSFKDKIIKVQRLSGKKSASCGDMFDVVRDVENRQKLFEMVKYKGKKISEMFDKANTPEGLADLTRLFQVKMGENNVPTKDIVPFNYFKLLHPMAPKDVRTLLNSSAIEKRENQRGGGASTPGGDTKADETIPF